MNALLTKGRMMVAVLFAVASMGMVAACDEVDDTGDGMAPPPEQQPMQ